MRQAARNICKQLSLIIYNNLIIYNYQKDPNYLIKMHPRYTLNLLKTLTKGIRLNKQYKIGRKNTALIIIDVQDKLIKVIEGSEGLIYNIIRIIEAAKLLDLEILITEQSPEKLGNTIDKILEMTKSNRYSKFNFSCINSKDLINSLNKMCINNIIIAGVETHICVLQSALDLSNCGFNVHVICDAVRSRNSLDHQVAIERMRNSGITISTTETLIFEICETSNRKEFRKISQLIKSKSKVD